VRIVPDGGDPGTAVDLAQIDPVTWWEQIAWVPQRPTITPGTVLDNVLDHAEPGASTAEGVPDVLVEAARATGFDEVVDGLPQGWRTPVGTAGVGLSVGQRQRLALTRVDPWSVMKASFLLSFAAGIMLIVATAVVWFMLDAMHVFSTIEELVKTVAGERSNTFSAIVAYLELPRALAVSTIVAVVDIVLVTALTTLGAFLYNITATLVGGIHLTLADE